MEVLLLDGYNLIHRARGGFQKGDWPIAFNFFRGLRPLVAKFDPDVCHLVLEGTPRANLELLPEYKANRQAPNVDFIRQKDAIVDLLKEAFPICVSYHPDFEADDVIANIAWQWCDEHHNVTIVSSDSDFIQMLGPSNIRLWNWRTSSFIEAPAYDYIRWKALKGDGTDNIPGIPGVGDKTASRMMVDANLFDKTMQDPEARRIYERNMRLIGLRLFSEEEMAGIRLHEGDADYGRMQVQFGEWGFRSMLKESTFEKYKDTFERKLA